MQTYLDCYPCFLRQALSAARLAGGDEDQQQAVLQKTMALLQDLAPDAQPPAIAHGVHRLVRKEIASDDPYRQAKEHSTRQALELYPRLREQVAQSDDALDTAIRLSIAGNIIDLGFKDDYGDLWGTVERVLRQPYAIDHLAALFERLANADHVLMLADNAGETVFDRILVETLSVPVTYAVKGAPVLNDATREDAVAAGLDGVTQLIDNGTDAPGTVLPLCSADFRQAFDKAPLILAKGQANYETLSTAGDRVFCLLQVKCPIIARDIQAPTGSIVVRQSG